MKPLKPGHHAVGVITNKARIDAISVEDSLSHVRLHFIRKRSNYGTPLGHLAIIHCMETVGNDDVSSSSSRRALLAHGLPAYHRLKPKPWAQK